MEPSKNLVPTSSEVFNAKATYIEVPTGDALSEKGGDIMSGLKKMRKFGKLSKAEKISTRQAKESLGWSLWTCKYSTEIPTKKGKRKEKKETCSKKRRRSRRRRRRRRRSNRKVRKKQIGEIGSNRENGEIGEIGEIGSIRRARKEKKERRTTWNIWKKEEG